MAFIGSSTSACVTHLVVVIGGIAIGIPGISIFMVISQLPSRRGPWARSDVHAARATAITKLTRSFMGGTFLLGLERLSFFYSARWGPTPSSLFRPRARA